MKQRFVKNILYAAVTGAAVAGMATGASAQMRYGNDYGYGVGYDSGPAVGWEQGYVGGPGNFGPRYGYETPAQHNACLQDFYLRPDRLNYRC
jgi:hypothetical protein